MKKMTIKQLIKLEDSASEVWVVSPSLYYDTQNNDFSEIVSVNLGEKTKYKYIVPKTKEIKKSLKIYQKKYDLSSKDLKNNFLILPKTDFNPFIQEVAIYNGSTAPVACTAPAVADGNLVIQLSPENAEKMAKSFKAIWKKHQKIDL
jgi:hypothetical protein